MLLTLFTLLTLFKIDFNYYTIQTALNCFPNILLGKVNSQLIWALWASEQKVEWMEWVDIPIDCYDYYSTCGGNKCFVSIENNLRRN